MARIVLCPTPKADCSGSVKKMADTLGLRKSHGTHAQAFECYRHYLLSLGYVRRGPREFESPEGPILVLTKRSRFGESLRPGKEGRFMSKNHTGGCCVG